MCVIHKYISNCIISFKLGHELNLKGAKSACKLFGSKWKMTRKTEGSLVCSTVPWYKNCNKCDSWRLLVWIDGACDISKYDPYSKCRNNATLTGHYYCGYDPCKSGDLSDGGTWSNTKE